MGTNAQDVKKATHAAEAAALGFYYQTLFALLTLISQVADDASVAVERLDDVEVTAKGATLLFQLKHSMSATPPPITLSSRAIWKTIKAWADVMHEVELAETTFCLVAVGHIPEDCPLVALLDISSDKTEVVDALTDEATRVLDARAAAIAKKKKPPHDDRYAGCEAFMALIESERLNFVRRMSIEQASTNIAGIEKKVAEKLYILAPDKRDKVARRLVEWWDRQIVYSLCGLRNRLISRLELQNQISSIIGDIEDARLIPDFTNVTQPSDYQPDGMLTRQIGLVNGLTSDIAKAIREEWKAREQRSKWLNSNPAMASVINDYDMVLEEYWSDRHAQMAEECLLLDEDGVCKAGLALLRWTHFEAPQQVPPISGGWNAPYLVRGSYQVLAIDMRVGWHASYIGLLRDE